MVHALFMHPSQRLALHTDRAPFMNRAIVDRSLLPPCRDRPLHFRPIIPLQLQLILAFAHDQLLEVQPYTPHDIKGIPLLPNLFDLAHISEIAVPVMRPRGFVTVDDLGEHRQALEVGIVPAHVVQAEVEGRVALPGILTEQHFLSAAEGQRVGIDAQPAASTKDDASGVRIRGHVGFSAEVGAVVRRRDGGVIVDYKSLTVVVLAANAAMAEPEQIPAIAVRGMWLLGRGLGGQSAAASGKELQLRFEGDVPVCVVLEEQGCGNTASDNGLGEVQMSSPGADTPIARSLIIGEAVQTGETFIGDCGAIHSRDDGEGEISERGGEEKGVELVGALWEVEDVDFLELEPGKPLMFAKLGMGVRLTPRVELRMEGKSEKGATGSAALWNGLGEEEKTTWAWLRV